MRATQGASIVLALAAVSAMGQAPPAFEVASVKVSPPREGVARYTAMDSDASMVRYSNITLKNLVAIAYRFDARLVAESASWMDSDPYDVAAKLPAGTSKDRVPEMLQTLLAERFQLAVHREKKDQRAYSLVLGKNGPKLKPAREEESGLGQRGQNQMLPGRIMGRAMPLGVLASLLAHVTGYQVIDKTGLAGAFDIDLKFAPENNPQAGPDLFAAIQEQLGLKMETGRAQVEMLVVDRAERTPVEN